MGRYSAQTGRYGAQTGQYRAQMGRYSAQIGRYSGKMGRYGACRKTENCLKDGWHNLNLFGWGRGSRNFLDLMNCKSHGFDEKIVTEYNFILSLSEMF
jgi:hypothetical protein